MAKKNNKKATPTPSNETLQIADLRSLMEQYPNASLRKLALAAEVSYGWLLKKSKEPVEGMPYDPTFVNYEAVAQVLAKKGINVEELDWAVLNEATLKHGSILPKDMEAFEVGKQVYLREDNEVPFDIVYKTESHIVLMKEGSTEPRAWSHSTFLMKGPVFEKRVINNKEKKEEA